MKIGVSQVYIEVGVNFTFSHLWQIWISEQLSSLTLPSAKFLAKYGDDFELIIRISAKKKLINNEIRGVSSL